MAKATSKKAFVAKKVSAAKAKPAKKDKHPIKAKSKPQNKVKKPLKAVTKKVIAKTKPEIKAKPVKTKSKPEKKVKSPVKVLVKKVIPKTEPARKQPVKAKSEPEKKVAVSKISKPQIKEEQKKIRTAKEIFGNAMVAESKTKAKHNVAGADKLTEVSIEEKLIALYSLQQIDSHIDKIHTVRGELPLEVQDLEDAIAGLETRISNYTEELDTLQKEIKDKSNSIKDSQALIKKYEDQQKKVRNNREYDSLTKEIEYQNLEIQLSEKKIHESKIILDERKETIKESFKDIERHKSDFEIKKDELKNIVSETEKQENSLMKKSKENERYIEERLLTAYKKIRQNARNGLAVVAVERDACGGCFNKIPPQRQLDIRMHKKIIVCEYCGRILVDSQIVTRVKS